MALASCYAALAPLLDLLHGILHRNRFPNFLLPRQQILTSLHKDFCFLLKSLEEGTFDSPNGATGEAVDRIGDAAYRVLDIIESEIPKHQIDPESASRGFHLIAYIFHQLISACQIAMPPPLRSKECDEDLHKVLLEVDSIVQEVMVILESRRGEDLQLNEFSTGVAAFQPAPDITSNPVVGLEDATLRVMEKLTRGWPDRQVISIVGMAGIGKTALARCIFYDPLVMNYFDLRVWVTISQEYNMCKLLQSILISLGMTRDEPIGRETLMGDIHRCLFERRYLIVIDDLWTTTLWDEVRGMLPDNGNGSRILLTTRLSDVANHISRTYNTYYIRFLDEDQSWDLLQREVFRLDRCPPELEHIGKSIAIKCEGLPLAILAIAGVLSNGEMSQNFWRMIDEDVDSILSRNDFLSNSLSLSYNHLPPMLKACFLYMGSFRKDYEINVSKLIKLWIAEGFFMSAGGDKTLEQMAEECFTDLVRRNLGIVAKEGANGVIKYCIMNNVWRSFCQQKSFVEGFFPVEQENRDMLPHIENVRCLSLFQTSPCEPHLHNAGKHLRTILWFGKTFGSNLERIEWDSLNLLRVLGVEVTTWPIPDAILQMFHLKYLELYVNVLPPGVRLPLSISALQNLQTLIISGPSFFTITLPPQIWNMTQLRHLIIGSMILSPVPVDTDMTTQKLEYLQTLMVVENFIFTKEAIQIIPNLRKLKISCRGSESSDMCEFYCLYNLVHLRKLEELKIVVDAPLIWSRFSFSYVDSLWSNIVFPLNLRKLSLGGCGFSWEEMTVVGSLPNLQVLRLRAHSFVGEEWEPTVGEFLRLKFLLLEKLDLKYWYAEEIHFPRLEHLKINECCELQEIPLGIGDISTLETIDIYASSEGVARSGKEIREEQEYMGNDYLRVRVDNDQ